MKGRGEVGIPTMERQLQSVALPTGPQPDQYRRRAEPSLVWETRRGDASLIAELAEEWRALCARMPRVRFSPRYLLPPFIELYLDSFAPDAAVRVITARRGGRLTVILPLVEHDIGWGPMSFRRLHSACNGHFPIFDVLHDEKDPDRLALELWDHLCSEPDWHAIQIDSAPEGGILDRVRRLARDRDAVGSFIDSADAPYLEVAPVTSLDEVMGMQSRSLRKELRRYWRRLGERGALECIQAGWDGDVRSLADSVETFLELEHRGWKGQAGVSALSSTVTSHFYRRLVDEPELRESVRVHVLKCGDETIVADIGLIDGKTFYGLRTAYNEDFRKFSPGHLGIAHTLFDLGQRGFEVFDQGGDADPYKLAWCGVTRTHGRIFLFRPGLQGRIANGLFHRLIAMFRRYQGERPLPSWLRRYVD